MTTPVQKNDIACGNGMEPVDHRVKREAIGSRIKIGIGLDLDPGGSKNTWMIGPGRLTEPNGRIREHRVQKITCYPQCSGATGRLCGRNATTADQLTIRTE